MVGIKSITTNPQITNLTNEIINMKTVFFGIKNNITDIVSKVNNDILPEISKIKLALQKIQATLIKLRKKGRSKKTEL
jgi:hypothetical protein